MRVVAHVDPLDRDARVAVLVLAQVVDEVVADVALAASPGSPAGPWSAGGSACGSASGRMPITWPSRANSLRAACGACCGSSVGLIWSASAVRLSTRTLPLRSRISPARRLHRDLADLVVLGLLQVLVAREHLEVPEAEEDDREHHQGDPAEDRDAQRELRGQDGPLAFVEHHGDPRGPTQRAALRRRGSRRRGARCDAGADRRSHAPAGDDVVDDRRAQDAADQRIERDREQERQEPLHEDLAEHQQAHRRVDAEHELRSRRRRPRPRCVSPRS